MICSRSHREKVAEAGIRRACGGGGLGPWLGAEEGSGLWPVVPTFVQSLELVHGLQFAPEELGIKGLREPATPVCLCSPDTRGLGPWHPPDYSPIHLTNPP